MLHLIAGSRRELYDGLEPRDWHATRVELAASWTVSLEELARSPWGSAPLTAAERDRILEGPGLVERPGPFGGARGTCDLPLYVVVRETARGREIAVVALGESQPARWIFTLEGIWAD